MKSKSRIETLASLKFFSICVFSFSLGLVLAPKDSFCEDDYTPQLNSDSKTTPANGTNGANPVDDGQAGKLNSGLTTDINGAEKLKREQDAKLLADEAGRTQEQRAFVASKKRANQNIVQSKGDPVGQQRAQEDVDVIKKFEEARKRDQANSKQAELAHDAEIRKNLLKISDLQEEHKEFKKEDARLTAQIAELGGLAAKLMANSKGMDTVPMASGKPSPILGSNNSENSSVSAQAVKEPVASKLSAEELKSKALELEIDPTGKLFAGKDAKSKAKIIKDYSLKKALTAKLQAEEKSAAQAKAAAAALAASNEAKAEKGRPANNVAKEVLGTTSDSNGGPFGSGSGSSRGFSLSNSESTAEVNRMISTLGNQESTANNLRAGILETDSPSLFERIHEVVNICLRKRCLVSRSNSP